MEKFLLLCVLRTFYSTPLLYPTFYSPSLYIMNAVNNSITAFTSSKSTISAGE